MVANGIRLAFFLAITGAQAGESAGVVRFSDYGVSSLFHTPPVSHLEFDFPNERVIVSDIGWEMSYCGNDEISACIKFDNWIISLPNRIDQTSWRVGEISFRATEEVVKLFGAEVPSTMISARTPAGDELIHYYYSASRGIFMIVLPGMDPAMSSAFMSTQSSGITPLLLSGAGPDLKN